MSNTKIKSSQFHGVVGHGTDGYFLITNGDGSMSWISNVVNPVISSLSYPGSATAADPAGGETITITGTGFKTGATVAVGGTAAPSVSYVSATSLTITTPAKAAGDYDVVVTNTDGGTATSVNGISFNGIPSWTTAAGSLGTFASDTTISTITLQATEPDAGTITFSITNGALPTGLSLTGANIDGTTTLETADTLYTFTVTATDDESQTTPRTFTITVTKQFINTDNFTINTYTGNGSTLAVEGKIGTAAQFNGTSSYIDTNAKIPASLNFSISFWFKTTSTAANQYIFSTKGNSATNGWWIQSNSGTIRYGEGNGSDNGVTQTSPASTYADGSWHHIVVTRSSGGTVNMYIDGNQVITDGSVGPNYMTSSVWAHDLHIGRYAASALYYFNGSLDQVRIFEKALSSSEVTTLYGENNTSTTKSTTDIFDDGSGVALYEFEKGAIDTGGVSGKFGSAAIFNGSSSVITQVKNIGIGDSLSVWFFPKTSTVYLYSNYDGTYDFFAITIEHNTGTSYRVRIFLRNITSVYYYPTTDYFTLTEDWHHFALNINSFTSYTAYIDGSEVSFTGASSGSTPTALPTSNNQMIGRTYINGSFNYFNGKIDQFRVFNKAISSSEVTTLYNETSASATKSTTDIFDDGSGVALYELEGNANDTGLYGRGAIDSGQSAVFNGTNSAFTASRMFSTSSSYSISFWLKMAEGTTTENCYFWQNNTVTQRALMVNYSGSGTNYGFSFNHKGATNNGQSSIVTFVPDGKWHHFVGTFNSSTSIGTLYIDGVQKNTFDLDPVSDTGNTLYMGGTYIYNGTQYYVPLSGLDEIRIYDDVLTGSEVEYLTKNDTSNIPTSNLLAHYKLDGNVNDETTNYNGTASNITYLDPAEFPTYDGTATNVSYAYDGTPTNVNFVGTSFQPDFVWIKNRDNTPDHLLFDSIRGAGFFIRSNTTDSQNTSYDSTRLTSFDSNGFTVGSATGNNTNNEDYVAWCWKAGGTAVSNTDGSITSSVSANQAAGFSIVKYTSTGTNGSTIGHGLSSAPDLVIIKSTTNTSNWIVYNSASGTSKYMYLNSTSGDQTASWFGTSATTFTLNNTYSDANTNGRDYIAYCFHSVDGFQKVGSFTGNGSTSGPIVDLGFEPAFLMFKCSSQVGNWIIIDNKRATSNPRTPHLRANSSSADDFGVNEYVDFLGNGFQPKGVSNYNNNSSGQTYIYLAIA